MKTKIVIGAVAAAAVVATAAAAVPAAKDWYESRHDQSSRYATGAEAKADRASVPRWLPDEAADVRYAMKTTGGERLLRATLADGKLPSGCEPLSGGASKRPALSASWFPNDASARARCGLYYAVTDGSTLYAWQDNEDWVADNKSR
ncbi:hypothetical protein I5Q34_05480 [Streptomyces sp. AV19]|uniref:hypothetical protein n=1 Tax=Streptomyces sp. AV19 TaxID=2793068 RepID=UPI0018FE40CB|nr:hypothetical protein [Streptomyces sp. AV19]MBH1933751.1 hypothetical protein [Streptomyces sp. AV19]MDG4535744.1 hypothetical protein [Streptomyces sp. AV19]